MTLNAAVAGANSRADLEREAAPADRARETEEPEPVLDRFPIEGGCALSSPFGRRRHPVTGRQSFHAGLDVSARPGTPVLAAGGGVVVAAGRRGAYGKLVVIDHGGGVKTRYAHLRRMNVRAGDLVESGVPIATVGATGRTTGPHLHFEVRVGGKAVNPMRFDLCRERFLRRDRPNS